MLVVWKQTVATTNKSRICSSRRLHPATIRRKATTSTAAKFCSQKHLGGTACRASHLLKCSSLGMRIIRNGSNSSTPTSITTDEGIIIHQGDPKSLKSGDGLGLVWGSVLWPSGISLSKYLVWMTKQQQRNNGYRNILELGCGTGIVGLTCAKYDLATESITFTDFEASALWPLLRESIEANGLDETKIHIHQLDWKDTSTFLSSSCDDDTTGNGKNEKKNQPYYDLIVAADVLYSGMDKLFARALASHLYSSIPPSSSSSSLPLEQRQPIALVACPFRKDSPLRGFFDACTKLGLSAERLQDISDGAAVGAFSGVKPDDAFRNSHFVPLDSEVLSMKEVCETPTFSSVNEKQIQIFRLKRIEGHPIDAIQIRRVSRI